MKFFRMSNLYKPLFKICHSLYTNNTLRKLEGVSGAALEGETSASVFLNKRKTLPFVFSALPRVIGTL